MADINIREIVKNKIEEYNEKNTAAIEYEVLVGGEEIEINILEKISKDEYIGSRFLIPSDFLLKEADVEARVEKALNLIEGHQTNIKK